MHQMGLSRSVTRFHAWYREGCVSVRGAGSGPLGKETFVTLPPKRRAETGGSYFLGEKARLESKRSSGGKRECPVIKIAACQEVFLRNSSPLRSTVRDASLFYVYMCLGVYIPACPDK